MGRKNHPSTKNYIANDRAKARRKDIECKSEEETETRQRDKEQRYRKKDSKKQSCHKHDEQISDMYETVQFNTHNYEQEN